MLYEVDVHFYPKRYEVIAENEREAKGKATDLFHEETGGQSVFEAEIIDSRE